jgi:hypothetical protein
MTDELIFPKVPIGEIARFKYRVAALPQTIYPSGFYLEIPSDEAIKSEYSQPWRTCRIRASLSSPSRGEFFSRTIDFAADWNGNSSPGRTSEDRRIFLLFTDYRMHGTTRLPPMRSYDLEVQVLQPSARRSDKLSIHAMTLLRDAKMKLGIDSNE